MLIAIPMLTVLVVMEQMTTVGIPLVPRTVFVLKELAAPLSAELSRCVIVPLIVVFFAGELVWREREITTGQDHRRDAGIGLGTPGGLSAPIYVQRHLIHSGMQTITLTVSRKPTLAGIDPCHLLDGEELDDDDNIEVVKIEPGAEAG
jgi:hypothetical protein